MARHKNILFIIIDQLRADCLTGALANHVRLPHLQALMNEAVTFRRHFSVTSPCGPSRTSILTGLYAMNHRSVRNGTPLDAGLTNIAREIRKAGYDPMLFGYTDTSMDPRGYHPADPNMASYERVMPGFNEKVEMCLKESYPWRAFLKRRGYDIPDYAEFYHPAPSEKGRPARLGDPAFYAAEDSDTAFLTNELVAELSVREHRNWFALATYIRPHPPFVAPEPYNRMYDGARLPLPVRKASRAEEAETHPFFAALLTETSLSRYVDGLDGAIDDDSGEQVQTLRATYLGLATEVDTHVGRVLQYLKKTAQYDDTLLIVTSDHGEMLGDHFMWGKDNVYDEAYHVPLIIRDPNCPEQHGSVVDAFTESVDVTPTILD